MNASQAEVLLVLVFISIFTLKLVFDVNVGYHGKE